MVYPARLDSRGYVSPTQQEHRMPTTVHIVFYSTWGHVYRLAEAVAQGAREVGDTNVEMFQVAETLPAEVLAKMGATEAKKIFAHIPLAQPARLAEADAVIVGTPTRYGLPTAQMQTFFDATGQLWAKRALVGKVGSAFTSTGTQHGGQESTLLSIMTFFFHQGMVVAGVPYAAGGISHMDDISGGTPYGASTVAGPTGARQVSENELEVARFQGRHVAEIARKLARR
jgi:NAD(P)H dehydrogenase (quinone)